MKTTLLKYIILLFLAQPSFAQMCPGGGVNFNSAVSFDPSWIYGCNTGTSCNGGVLFSNQLACQPTTAMDACAPAPSCGAPSNDASNIWFKFFPTGPTATISCFQNSSLVIGIQAFSGSACGALTELGCALAGGPSSGVQLPLSGLQPGTLYYFRIFGSARPVSQRTGNYCFCGTTGLNNILLPVVLSGFSGQATDGKTALSWTASSTDANLSFDIERSPDGISFNMLAHLPETGNTSPEAYHYLDASPVDGLNYYRIKVALADGSYTYSDILSVKANAAKAFALYNTPASGELQVSVSESTTLLLLDASGRLLQTIRLSSGRQHIPTGQLASGIYFLRSVKTNQAYKFYVSKY
jgi:hypothetical protein